jgi:aryl-alcohol dehydrogenase-like predicted oxidoreductase
VSTVILGASKVHQLEETLGALDVVPQLTGEVVNRIEEIVGTKPVLPEY